MEITYAMCNQENITIDLLTEGPCVDSLGLYKILDSCSSKCNYDLGNVTLLTSNSLETHPTINIEYIEPLHLLDDAIKMYKNALINKTISKHFGSFIGKGNAPRLHLNAYLHKHHSSKTLQLYRFNVHDDYYRDNIGLEKLLMDYDIDIIMESEFLTQCPVLVNDAPVIKYTSVNMNAYAKNNLIPYYDSIFIDIVQESYYTGNTFFPTEKIWRPIILKTPFIVQGSQGYLHNLKKLGFKTFDKWWDEGYSEDSPNHSLIEIKNVLDKLSKESESSLCDMYNEMQDVLEHNYRNLFKLHTNYKDELYVTNTQG
jgi:hypothetical protein